MKDKDSVPFSVAISVVRAGGLPSTCTNELPPSTRNTRVGASEGGKF